MVVKRAKYGSIRSRALNIAIVICGSVLITLAADTWFEALRSEGMADFWGATMDPFVVVFPLLWTLLGGWCLLGGIRNLLTRVDNGEHPYLSEQLTRWHLKAIAVTVVVYIFVAVAHFRWHSVSLTLFVATHYALVGLFLLIPVTVVISLILRRSEGQHE
jgi:succinate dehydrogenase/fumarate reductase cytochrome b subunit